MRALPRLIDTRLRAAADSLLVLAFVKPIVRELSRCHVPDDFLFVENDVSLY